jgi:hypothetical protein
MQWTIRGAANIATLRCQDARDRWDEIWQRPHNQTSTGRQGIRQQNHTQITAG